MSRFNRKTPVYDNSGLSTLVSNQGNRFLNRDGTFNVHKTGVPFLERISFFNSLITMSWPAFFVLIFGGYFLVNLVFAIFYYFAGAEDFLGVANSTDGGRFLDIFFFSAQTLTTVGYGRVNPTGLLTNIVASIEALSGLLSFALATGLMYGRFSRPVANIRFSDQALIAPYRGGKAVMFRLANTKNNQLIDASIQVLLGMIVKDSEKEARQVYRLELERSEINFFAANWTVVHPLDEKSPLFGMSQSDFEKMDVEFMISLRAYDDTFGQSIHARHSFKYFEMVWDARFKPMFTRSTDGRTTILKLNAISDYENV